MVDRSLGLVLYNAHEVGFTGGCVRRRRRRRRRRKRKQEKNQSPERALKGMVSLFYSNGVKVLREKAAKLQRERKRRGGETAYLAREIQWFG